MGYGPPVIPGQRHPTMGSASSHRGHSHRLVTKPVFELSLRYCPENKGNWCERDQPSTAIRAQAGAVPGWNIR